MTKRKKLAKRALKHPERFSYGELAYFQRWLEEHKQQKAMQKRLSQGEPKSEQKEPPTLN